MNAHPTSLTPNKVESALESIGNNAAKTNEYGASAKMFDSVDKIFGKVMGDAVLPVKEKRHWGR